MNLKPMKAASTPNDLGKISFPALVSAKLDGIRCVIVNGQALSYTLKPIPNRHIQNLLSHSKFDGLDGELIVGAPNDPACMRNTNSGVMSRDGEPDFHFHAFDRWDSDEAFITRLESIQHLSSSIIRPHPHTFIQSVSELEQLEDNVLSQGYEGLVVRSLSHRYKFGRSTLREGGMIKLKRFEDAEAVIIGFEELYSNQNEATIDNLGRTARSSHQENKIPMNTLGALVCRTLPQSDTLGQNIITEFNVGSGFTATERDLLWAQRDTLEGRIIKYKYFKVGMKDRPRHPTFLSFRDPRDL